MSHSYVVKDRDPAYGIDALLWRVPRQETQHDAYIATPQQDLALEVTVNASGVQRRLAEAVFDRVLSTLVISSTSRP
ncbi:MAG: hypothetical protein HY675_26705 [Chloroflexi bacterium]|nr:hypothetical protein [Chloroflexota bacterium]